MHKTVTSCHTLKIKAKNLKNQSKRLLKYYNSITFLITKSIMKTITLKTQDDFFDQIGKMAADQHLSKSALIRKAIQAYQKQLRGKEIVKQMQVSSLETRGMDKELFKDFDSLDDEYLLNSWKD